MIEIPLQLQNLDIKHCLVESKSKAAFEKAWQLYEEEWNRNPDGTYSNKITGVIYTVKEKINGIDTQVPYTGDIHNYSWNNPILQQHLASGGNYGAMGGGKLHLIIVDIDVVELIPKIQELLPKTFPVKTGSGKLHLYFFSDRSESFKIKGANNETLIDVQGNGTQAVAPGSTHPTGNKYEAAGNEEIAFIPYAELQAALFQFDERPQKTEKKTASENKSELLDNLLAKVTMTQVLNYCGVDTSRNPTKCPLHNSKGGKCLGYNDVTAHCFNCEGKWNALSALKDFLHLDTAKAIEELAKLAGMEKELEEDRKKYSDTKKETKFFADPLTDWELIAQSKPFNYDELKPYFNNDSTLPYFKQTVEELGFIGDNYNLARKAFAYQFNASLQPALRFRIGKNFYDNRPHILIISGAGFGKGVYKNTLKRLRGWY